LHKVDVCEVNHQVVKTELFGHDTGYAYNTFCNSYFSMLSSNVSSLDTPKPPLQRFQFSQDVVYNGCGLKIRDLENAAQHAQMYPY
jgi:hypothetical protein